MRIDAHMHVVGRHASAGWQGRWEDDREVIETADKLGIDQLCCSIPIQGKNATPDQVREVNDSLRHTMHRFPDRILGYAYIDPGYRPAALAEMDRCILKHGMIGIKLYNQYRCWDPVAHPIVERAIELGVPILHHGGHQTPTPNRKPQPNRSDSRDFVRLARRYPEAMIIEGHPIVGDWEWAIRVLRDAPNVYVDTSGSVLDEGMIEMAVRELGVNRVLFATDVTMEGGVGKVLAARVTERQREWIFWKNMAEILRRRR